MSIEIYLGVFMKKIILAICILTVSFFLISCQEPTTTYEIIVEIPDYIYKGDKIQIYPISENVSDRFTYNSSNLDVATIDKFGNIHALSIGTTTIKITNIPIILPSVVIYLGFLPERSYDDAIVILQALSTLMIKQEISNFQKQAPIT